MKVKFVRDVFNGGVRIHAQDEIAELDATTERWLRRGAAVEVKVVESDEEDLPRRRPGRPSKSEPIK